VLRIPAYPGDVKMATIINRSQQVTTAGLNPAPAYSRVVCVQTNGMDQNVVGTAYTSKIGQNFWLLNVKVWIEHSADAAAYHVSFLPCVLEAVPPTAEEWQRQESIIHGYRPVETRIITTRTKLIQFDWSMRRRYVGSTKRLGLYALNHQVGYAWASASFEISEG